MTLGKQPFRSVRVATRTLLSLLVIVSAALGLGALTEKMTLTRHLDTLFTVFRHADQLYVQALPTERLLQGAIDGMLGQMDPYSEYIPPEGKKNLRFMTTGEYAGVGAIISGTGKGYPVVSMLYEGMPAHRAGLREGDTIVQVDSFNTRGAAISEVSSRLQGEAKSRVTVQIRRYKTPETLRIPITREAINTPAVPYSTMLEGGIGYVVLESFTAGCGEQVVSALERLGREGELRGCILDLRGNPGGLLEEAPRLLSAFLPDGTEVVRVVGRDGEVHDRYTTRGKPRWGSLPLAVLIGRRSASSSEVVAGAIQDLDRGVVLGDRSYGKGLVQTTIPLQHGGIFKLTTARYHTPSGRCIQAIDYGHPLPDGSVGEIPDSLVQRFSTRGGRSVYDGGGIYPDVRVVDSVSVGTFCLGLYRAGAFSAYAIRYADSHPTAPPADQFAIDDATIGEFRTFCKGRYDSITLLSQAGDALKMLTTDEDYGKVVAPHLAAARRASAKAFDSLFVARREQVRRFLEAEIALHYYHQRAPYISDRRTDETIGRARTLLLDTATYRGLLRLSPADPRGLKVPVVEQL